MADLMAEQDPALTALPRRLRHGGAVYARRGCWAAEVSNAGPAPGGDCRNCSGSALARVSCAADSPPQGPHGAFLRSSLDPAVRLRPGNLIPVRRKRCDPVVRHRSVDAGRSLFRWMPPAWLLQRMEIQRRHKAHLLGNY